MENKEFIKPEANIVIFANEDVIVTSPIYDIIDDEDVA